MTEKKEPKTALQLLSEIAAHPNVFDVQLGVHGHKNGDVWAVIIGWIENRPNTIITRDDDGPLAMLADVKRILDIGASLKDAP